MEADVVVNFINFFINVEEEELPAVLDELQEAGIERSKVDEMVQRVLQNAESREEGEGGEW